MAADETGLVNSRADIIEKFSQLFKNNCVFDISFGDLGMLSTKILHIDDIESAIMFSLDETESLNKKMVTSPTVTFRTELGFVQAAFTTKNIKIVTNDARESVFLVDIPSSLHWVTRRQHGRKKIPVPNSSFCEVLFPPPTQNSPPTYKEVYPKVKTQTLRLSLHDVSFSGFSMLNNDPSLSPCFEPSMIFNNCKIILADKKEIQISFEVMSKRKMDAENGDFSELIGIKFVDIKHKLLK